MTPRPAMLMRQAERVNVKELIPTPDGLAVDPDGLFRYIGDVTNERYTNERGTTTNRWFGWTLTDVSLGPHNTRRDAINALLAYNGLRLADPHESVTPLF